MASTGEAEQVDAVGTSLGARFETESNALNFLRLVLALEVVVWHAYGLRGSTWLPSPVEALLGDVAVDSFFAISGFLIVRAWCRRPDAGRFLIARASRILPGLWVCLLVTGFVIAPAVTSSTTVDGWGYVAANADTWGIQYGIAGGPVGVPISGVWNGALWSLGYETGCYLAVLALGAVRLPRPRVVIGVAAGCWTVSASFSVAGVGQESTLTLAARCGLMFAAGALAWFHRDWIPVSGRLGVVAVALLGLGVVALPDYRLVAAPAVAYLAVAGGVALGRYRALVLRHDLSYSVYIYGFPIQQLLLLLGVSLGWAGFAAVSVAAVLPVAALSWFLVERPTLRLARQLMRSQSSRTLADPAPNKFRPKPTKAGVNVTPARATSVGIPGRRRSAVQMDA